MLLLNSPTLETTKEVPCSVQAMKCVDFGSLIILGRDGVSCGQKKLFLGRQGRKEGMSLKEDMSLEKILREGNG